MNTLVPIAALASLSRDRYQLHAQIGVGGGARVYRATDTAIGCVRAVKVMAPSLFRLREARQRFLREARTMAQLEHRNIVQLYNVGSDGNQLFLVMELVEGGTLAERVERHGPMDASAAVRAVLDVLSGLAFAHRHGVVHRDVKPHNVLIDRHGGHKLADFGIAHLSRPGDSMTETGMRLGTLAYMSPEQRIDSKAVCAQSDLYSTGATLCALLTGRNPGSLFFPESHRECLAGVPGPLARVIVRATAYNPTLRYPSADAMADALRQALSELSIADAPTQPRAEHAALSADPTVVQLGGPEVEHDFFFGGTLSNEVSEPTAPPTEDWRAWFISAALLTLLGISVGIAMGILLEA